MVAKHNPNLRAILAIELNKRLIPRVLTYFNRNQWIERPTLASVRTWEKSLCTLHIPTELGTLDHV